jgi:hypothetical protein
MFQLSFNCNYSIKVVLDCTIVYILLIIEHKGDVSPENYEVHLRVHNSPPTVHTLSQLHPI